MPALSSLYTRPPPTIACALHNVLEAATKGLQSDRVGITTARGRVENSPSISEEGTSTPTLNPVEVRSVGYNRAEEDGGEGSNTYNMMELDNTEVDTYQESATIHWQPHCPLWFV